MWKTPRKIIVSTNNNFNFLYSEQEDTVYDYAPVSGVFNARIQWGDPQKLMEGMDIKEKILGNVCRIKVKKEAVDFLADSTQIEIDGRKVEPIGTTRPHGLFNIDYYTVFFRESD